MINLDALRPQSVRTVGDGTSAVLAFKDALNKPDFADVTFKIVSSSSGADALSSRSADSSPASSRANSSSQTQQQQQHSIHAHRAILAARSPVFKEMFFGGFPESRQKEVVVEDFKFEHFMTVLEWAYCGSASMSARDVLGVLQAANYYGLDDLMLECRDLAQSFIDEENVLHLLEHASSLGETSLVVQCLNFIKSHAHAVLTSPVWLTVSAECVERVLSLPAIDCEEALLFDQSMAWLEANTTLRADVAATMAATSKKSNKKRKSSSKKKSPAPANKKVKKAAADVPQQQEDDGDEEKTAEVAADGGDGDNTQQPQTNAAGVDGDNANSSTDGDDSNDNEHQDDDEDEVFEEDDDDEVQQGDDDDSDSADEQQPKQKHADPASTSSTSNNSIIKQRDSTPSASGCPRLESRPLVRRFFRLLRLSHLSVSHLLDQVRPLLLAHPCIRSAYISALEFLVSPGHISSVSQVPRAPTVLSTVQIDIPGEFLRGWKHLVTVPQSSNTGLGFNQSQTIPSNFFSEVPAHAAYLCVGEMVLGREDAISVIAVGCIRIVRPIIGSRTPVVAEDGDICWHASQTSFGFTPKNGDGASGWGGRSSGGGGGSSSGSSMVTLRPASSTPSARARAGVRFQVAPVSQMSTTTQDDAAARAGKRFIYYK